MNAQAGFGSNIDDDTTMPEGALVREPPKSAVKSDRLARYKQRVWIMLEDNENIPPTGQFIGHDGVGFMLQAGVAAEVPLELIDILNNAVYLAPTVDQATKQIIGYRERLRFPYRVVAKPATAQAA